MIFWNTRGRKGIPKMKNKIDINTSRPGEFVIQGLAGKSGQLIIFYLNLNNSTVNNDTVLKF